MELVGADAASALTRKLATFSTDFKLADAPRNALANAKLAILDCLGVAVLAATQEAGTALMHIAEQEGWHGPCAIWGTERSASSRDAAFANGTLAHALDYDDGGHASTYILAAAMAIAEREGASGNDLLGAFIVGREARMALEPVFADRFEGVGPGARGWHANGIFGAIAAACTAAKILDLDHDLTLNAIGLAAGSCGALGRDGGTLAKPFRAGQAAATGVTCALLAREGFTGDEQVLEGAYGLLSAIGPVNDKVLSSLGQDLGREYDLSKHGVKVKNIAAGARAHAPVEAALRLLQKKPIATDQLQSITCDLHPYPLLRLRPKRGHEGRFSMAYCLALALVFRRLDPTDFNDTLVNDSRVQGVMEIVKHAPGSKVLTIELKDGTTLSEHIRPASDMREWTLVAKKFCRSVREILTEAQQARVLNQVEHLEDVALIRSLTTALRPAVAETNRPQGPG